MNDQDCIWVADDAELASWCQYWAELEAVAVDTEFIRRTTYFPITGLIQVSDGEKAVLIDPLAIRDFSPLKELMLNKHVVKVFHACSEDLEVFDRLLGVLPDPFYDTQIGEAYVSGQWSLSYVKLIQAYLGIELAKDETRSDWLARPLTDAQKRYAALDVVYLAQVYRQQYQQLEKKGMVAWAQEDCDQMTWQYRYNSDPALNWSNLKSAWQLSPRSLTLLRSLFIWRDQQARVEDVPKGQVLKDRTLWSLAKKLPDNHRALSGTEELSSRQQRIYGEELIRQATQVRQMEESELEVALPAPLPSQAGELSKSVRRFARQKADELKIAPEALLKRKQLDPILRHLYEGSPLDTTDPVLTGWRKEVIVDPVLTAFTQN